MTTTHRRIALLTGASIAALGIAAPALAAPHDGLADGLYPGVNTTDDTVVICDLAGATTTPLQESPCFFGEIDTSDPADSDGQQHREAAGSISMTAAQRSR